MANVPHLVKLLRNHFVDQGFILNGNLEINKAIIDVTGTSDLKITDKISKESLNVQGTGRQKVKLATKLFSHTISMAIARRGTMGLLKQANWLECAQFFKLVIGDSISDSRDRTKAYGLASNIQDAIITKMIDTIEKIRVKGKKCLLPFQKGIVMTNSSLRLLFEDMKARFSSKHLLTYRLNQDVLETFFGAIRTKGGLHGHPEALQFKYRLRSYILGRNEGTFSSFGNVEDDTPNIALDDVNLCGKYFSLLQNNTVADSEAPTNIFDS